MCCSMHLVCCVVAPKHKTKRKQNNSKTQRQTKHTLSLSLAHTHTHTHTHNRNAVASASSGEFSGGVQCVLPAGNFRESFLFWYSYIFVTLSFSHPLHRYEFGPPKFFSKTFKFSKKIYSTWQSAGGGQCRNACRSQKKESKQSEITWEPSEPVRSICKIEKRREIVQTLWWTMPEEFFQKALYS